MKGVKTAFRKIKQKLNPLVQLDVYNQHHQLLIFSFVLIGTLLFALLHSLFSVMFRPKLDFSTLETTSYNSYLNDFSKCWRPEGEQLESNDPSKQYLTFQRQWSVNLNYINCKTRSTIHLQIDSLPVLPNNNSTTIRNSPRTVYDYDVVKYLTQQIKNEDYMTSSSKACNVHIEYRTNVYYNHNQILHVNSTGQTAVTNESQITSSVPTSSPTSKSTVKSSTKHSDGKTVALHRANNDSVSRHNNITNSRQATHEQLTHYHHVLTHNRLSDAGVCLKQAYTFSTGSGANNELLKCLPSFIIAGVMKSGTGELMKWLNTHPNLVSGRGTDNKNEIHYFSPSQLPQYSTVSAVSSTEAKISHYNEHLSSMHKEGTTSTSISTTGMFAKHHKTAVDKSTSVKTTKSAHPTKTSQQHIRGLSGTDKATMQSAVEYANFIEYAARFPSFHNNQANTLYTFDKSPNYIRSANIMYNIHNMLPSVKIIILLRNPVQRAVSAFSHNCRHGRYIKLLMNFDLNGIQYKKDSIVTINTDYLTNEHKEHPLHSNKSNKRDHSKHVLNVNDLKNDWYKVLKHPCNAGDLHTYLFGLHSSKSIINNNNTAATRSANDGISLVSTSGTNKTTTQNNSNNNDINSSNRTNKTVSTSSAGSALRMSENSHHLAPEIEHGFYDEQLAYVLKIFPRDQVLILFQESMYKNTFKTLRQVEQFLQIPCFDYSTVALIPTSEGDGNDESAGMGTERESGPPKRAPVTFDETITHYKNLAKQFFQTKKKSHSSSSQLHYDMYPDTTLQLANIFKGHNQQLQLLLRQYGMITEASLVREHNWDL